MKSDLFSGTADYYARYPERLLQDIRELVEGVQADYLVDWGCGTGELALPLSPSFKRVRAIDIDPEMIVVARRRAAESGVTNVDWKVGRAEEFPIEPESCDVITAGSSFHWMDRELLSQRAHTGLRRGAPLVLVGGGSSVWDENAEWHSVAVRCLRKHLGEPRRARSATYTSCLSV